MAKYTQEEIDTQVQSCYAIDNNDDAMDCLTKLIQGVSDLLGICSPKFALFTNDGCPFCAEEKEKKKDKLASGVMHEVNLDTPEGAKIAEQNGVEYTPAILLLDCHNKAFNFPDPVEEHPVGVSV